MEQQGEVRVNCAFAELMTGQQQVMDFDKYLCTFIDPTPDLPDFIFMIFILKLIIFILICSFA